MWNFKYENQGANTYLVYSVPPDNIVDTLSLGMLTNNSIPGLAKTLFTQMDGDKYIKYNVSAKISMQQFFSGVVNRKRLLAVFVGIVDGLMSAEDYMIDTSSIILDPKYIFVDVSTCAATLICLPIMDIGTTQLDLGAFFKNIMVNTQFDQTENSYYVVKIFNFLNGSPIFSISDFKKLLDDLKNESDCLQTQSVVNQPLQTPNAQTVSAPTHFAVPQQNVPPVTNTVQPTQPKLQSKPQPAVPTKNTVTGPPVAQVTQNANTKPEKKITMFSLLMHYSKENKALYEQQKAARKAGKGVEKKSVQQQGKQLTTNPGFAVPGANSSSSNSNSTIPGQSNPEIQKVAPSKLQPQPTVSQVIPNQQLANQPIQNKPYTSTVSQVIPNQQLANQPIQNKPYTSTVSQVIPNQQLANQPIQNKPYTSTVVPQGQHMNFGETTVLGGGRIGETTVLSDSIQQSRAITPHLIRNKNNERILLDKPVFRIGKEKSYVDYFIGDNTAVSRSHANIVTRGNSYYIVDTNSTNHTFVNGKMIQSNTETVIHHGDKICLGNEGFEFKLY